MSKLEVEKFLCYFDLEVACLILGWFFLFGCSIAIIINFVAVIIISHFDCETAESDDCMPKALTGDVFKQLWKF